MTNYLHMVQYYETDRMDCVHHSNYIRWFEEARCFFLAQLGFGYDRMEQEGVLSPVLKAEAQYLSMTRFGDAVEIETTVCSYTGTRITFGYTVRDRETGVTRCQGSTSHCFIGASGRPLSLKKHLPQMHAIMTRYFFEKNDPKP